MSAAGGGRAAAFEALLSELPSSGGHFGHREHVALTWLAIRRYGAAEAAVLIEDGIRRTAAAAGAPQKYHATMTRAWLRLIGHRLAQDTAADFPAFAAHHPDLLDAGLLLRHYRRETLSCAAARAGWVEPDLAPLPD